MIEYNQILYIFLWLFFFIVPSMILLKVLGHYRIPSWIFYLSISVVFIIATILRIAGLYPGKFEPLWIDMSTALISAIFVYFTKRNLNLLKSMFVHLIFLIIITIPHLIYIISVKDIGHPWFINL